MHMLPKQGWKGWLKAAALLLVGSFVLPLQGCGLFGGSEDSPAVSQTMEVTVNMQDLHRCSVISPEIQVVNPPQGTKLYDVRLFERNGQEEVFLGGGSWVEDGTGLIPEGALTGRYRGPCPPEGKKREYFFVVSALASEDSQPLAVRLYKIELE